MSAIKSFIPPRGDLPRLVQIRPRAIAVAVHKPQPGAGEKALGQFVALTSGAQAVHGGLQMGDSGLPLAGGRRIKEGSVKRGTAQREVVQCKVKQRSPRHSFLPFKRLRRPLLDSAAGSHGFCIPAAVYWLLSLLPRRALGFSQQQVAILEAWQRVE